MARQKIPFTERSITALTPEDKPFDVFERNRPYGTGSFGVRVHPSGKKTFHITYLSPTANKVRRYTLGMFSKDYPVAKARTDAAAIMVRVQAGEDPHADKRFEKLRARLNTDPTVNDFWEIYQADFLTPDGSNGKPKRKPKSDIQMRQEVYFFRKLVSPVVGDMLIRDVQRWHLEGILERYAEKAPVGANRAHAFLNVFFKSAVSKGIVKPGEHPLAGSDRPGGIETSRDRILSDKEIRKIWPHLDKLSSTQRDVLKLCFYTCQRSGEIMCMEWEQVDLENAVWRQEVNKAGVPTLVPLSPQVIAILSARERRGKYVFPGTPNRRKDAGHVRTTRPSRLKLQEWSGVTDWTTHDLRRTGRTIMSRIKVDPIIAEMVLNHSLKGILGSMQKVYDRYTYLDEKRQALENLASEIDRIVKPAQVIPIKKTA